MRRIRWETVAALTLAFIVGAAAALLSSVHHVTRERTELATLPFPEDAPFDLADRRARAAFDEYTRFARDAEASLAFQCDKGSGEIYRVEVFAAMDTHPDLALVDVTAGGNRAVVEVRKFVGDAERWHLVAQHAVSDHEIGDVRDRATRLLSSRIPVAGERPLDAAEWTVQICRRGRYHFFQRGPKRDAPEDAPFVAFTNAVMAVRRGAEAAP
jgi:hypothetical protein